MVATSTLELGIDIGDLDRVIQIDVPFRVASFLQRLGRTGRRPGTRANCLFLTTRKDAFLRASALLSLWSEGFVEPVEPPAEPFHVLAQQWMALCLQEGGIRADDARVSLAKMPGFAAMEPAHIDRLWAFLNEENILWQDGGIYWLGSESERRYQRRNFLELLSLITDSPLFTVIHGQKEIGTVDRASFLVQPDQVPILLLGGRSWKVEHIGWRKRICYVSAVKEDGRSRWPGEGQALGFELCRAMRRILRDEADPPGLTRRGRSQLEEQRSDFEWLAHTDSPSIFQTIAGQAEEGQEVRWWTFAGLIGNATLLGHLRPDLHQPARYDNLKIIMTGSDASAVRKLIATGELAARIEEAEGRQITPQVDQKAIEALKFSECLPKELQRRVIEARWTYPGVAAVAQGERKR